MKRSTILALAGAMTVFLTACGGESPTKPTPSVNQEPAAVETKDRLEDKLEDKSVSPRAEADTAQEVPADTAPDVPADQPAPEPEVQPN